MIIGKITDKLTLQVSDLMNKMIENAVNVVRQASEKKSVGIRNFKEEDRGQLLKDIHDQMKKFQGKYE